jgi:hypothetical protein
VDPTTRNLHITCGFFCENGQKIRRKRVKTFVGNCFLRFLESAGNFPAEFPAQNDNETVANVPANNPQVIQQKTCFRRKNHMKIRRK